MPGSEVILVPRPSTKGARDPQQFPFNTSYELPFNLDNGFGESAYRYAAFVDINDDGARDEILAPARYAINAAYA